ncbi:hypothetical protein ACFL2W_00855, partial [Candidatus Omnitrophota bacterium]
MKVTFVTREEEYKLLHKRVDSFLEGYRQNIALIGPGFSGKTYLIEQLLKTDKAKEHLVPLYLDLESLSFSEFVRTVFTSLLFTYLKKQTGAKHYHLDSLILESQNLIPRTTLKIKNVLGLPGTKEKASFEW